MVKGERKVKKKGNEAEGWNRRKGKVNVRCKVEGK